VAGRHGDLTVNGLAETASPEAEVTVISPVRAPWGTVTFSLVSVEADEMVAWAPPTTTATTPERFLPVMVEVDPGAPLVGAKLFRSVAASPVQNRGSVAGVRNVATEPDDSTTRRLDDSTTRRLDDSTTRRGIRGTVRAPRPDSGGGRCP
jgi:hypothetical protein